MLLTNRKNFLILLKKITVLMLGYQFKIVKLTCCQANYIACQATKTIAVYAIKRKMQKMLFKTVII